jgi:hypothetical protein
MNSTLLSEILTFIVDLLATLRGDPTHAAQAQALSSVNQVAAAVAGGSDLNASPVHAELQRLSRVGRAVTPEEWESLHSLSQRLLKGEAAPAPSAHSPASPARKVIQPAG